jgi:hypothetical protein
MLRRTASGVLGPSIPHAHPYVRILFRIVFPAGRLGNGDEVPEWRGIGNGDHAVNLLTRTARRRFE